MANLSHRTSQKMIVLSKLPLSGLLAKMSKKPLISAKILGKDKKKGLHFPSASNSS